MQWSLQFKRDYKNSRNLALTYEESLQRRVYIENIRRVAQDITKRYTARVQRLKETNDKEECGHSGPKKRKISE